MMDLADLIKWLIPCAHISRIQKTNTSKTCYILVCLFLLFNITSAIERKENSLSNVNVKYVRNTKHLGYNVDRSDSEAIPHNDSLRNEERSLDHDFSGRTFGRPFKKMMAGLLPIIFQLGAASTWAVIATVIGAKTLAVTLIILKLLLMAGAAKLGALFATKEHHHKHQEWTPQKEIHLHIHNGHAHEAHEEHYSPWNREGNAVYPIAAEPKTGSTVILDQMYGGPQTISTPYGNYVKLEVPNKARRRRRRHLK